MTLPAFPAPSPAMILEWVAAKINLTGSALTASRGIEGRSIAKFRAAWLMRECGHSWPVIAKALGYAGHCSAIHAARRWERMRRKAR